MPNKDTTKNQVTSNAQDIGYVLGKLEMIEKKFAEDRIETKTERDEIMEKLEELSENMSFWRYTMWFLRAAIISIPLVVTANFDELLTIWRGE
jgi:anti-sigma-K factor RskA